MWAASAAASMSRLCGGSYRAAAWALLLASVWWGTLREAQAARDPTSEVRPGSLAVDTLSEEYAHLHVAPSAHRISLRRDSLETLAYSFFLRASSSAIKLVLPPGYKLQLNQGLRRLSVPGCEILAAPEADLGVPAYSRQLNSSHLGHFITGCKVKGGGDPNSKTRIWIDFATDVPSLSAEEAPRALHPAHWWYFYLCVQLPQATPAASDNHFTLEWTTPSSEDWHGKITFPGWPLLGDWECVYSDWEGWGSCSARCGGGSMRLRRRILMEPPDNDTDRKCKEELVRDEPCNDHPCLWPCTHGGELATEEQPAVCTAMCGGGLHVGRQKWVGQNCPRANDMSAAHLSPCNNEPCQAPCVRSDQWTAVTECSQQCGEGSFWMMQPVVQKDMHSATCAPFWRQQKCMRQECHRLLISRPDRNLLPQVNSKFRMSVIFQMPKNLNGRRIELVAPDGYSFGARGASCQLYHHDLMPHLTSCAVGKREEVIVLSMSTPLPPNAWGNYHFMVDVIHPDCPIDNWVVDALLTTLTCHVDSDSNRWRMEFADASSKSTSWESYIAAGYTLYAPTDVDTSTYSFRNREHCTGQIRWSASQFCMDMSGDTAAAGASVKLYNCSKERLTNQEWIVPPLGTGTIVNAADDKKCIGISRGKLGMFVCGEKQYLQFSLPPLGIGPIRWVPDPNLCLAVVNVAEGTQSLEIQLMSCTDGPSMRWESPCEGNAAAAAGEGRAAAAADVDSPLGERSQKSQADIQVLTRRQRPRFCSARMPCPSGVPCTVDGMCAGAC